MSATEETVAAPPADAGPAPEPSAELEQEGETPEEDEVPVAHDPDEEEDDGEDVVGELEVQSEKDVERAIQSLIKEATRHANRVSQIMGEEAQMLVPCELCAQNIPGFRWDTVPPEPVVTAVRAAIGLPDMSTYNSAPDARQCDVCSGRGELKTHSQVPGYEVIQCARCGGRGYLRVGTPDEVGIVPPAAAPVADLYVGVDDRLPEKDPWGRDSTDPLYGVMPNYAAARQARSG